jgi:hypothetical protein
MLAGAAINELDFGVVSMKLVICDHIIGHEKSSFRPTRQRRAMLQDITMRA